MIGTIGDLHWGLNEIYVWANSKFTFRPNSIVSFGSIIKTNSKSVPNLPLLFPNTNPELVSPNVYFDFKHLSQKRSLIRGFSCSLHFLFIVTW
jgi:hypothetical protein